MQARAVDDKTVSYLDKKVRKQIYDRNYQRIKGVSNMREIAKIVMLLLMGLFMLMIAYVSYQIGMVR